MSQIKFSVPIFEFLRIPEHRKRAFEYLGLKEDVITQIKNVNSMDVPPISVELEVPKALEDLGESPKVYLGTSLVESHLDVDPFYNTLIIKDQLVHNYMFKSGASCNMMPLK
ncbi:hypothetical protein KI387_016597, partial [Taxus chinensis]